MIGSDPNYVFGSLEMPGRRLGDDTMKTITIVTKDKIGLLADITYILGKKNINIDGVSVDVIGGNAIISLTIKDAHKAAAALRESNYDVTETNTLFVKVSNIIGGINSLTNKLAENKINIQNINIVSNDNDNGVFALNVDRPRKAMKILGEFIMNRPG